MRRRSILTPELLADLPVHDPEASFLMIVEQTQDFLDDALRQVDDNEQGTWARYTEAKHKAVNTIIASAKRFEIAEFGSFDVPFLRNFDDDQFDQFMADLDHYITQTLLDHEIRTRRDSFTLPLHSKERLRSHLAGMKEHIDRADVNEAKRAKLHSKLREFEALLDRDRFPAAMAIGLLLGLVSLGADAIQYGESSIMNKLVANMLGVIGEAKAADDATREMPPHELPRPAVPPRQIGFQPAILPRESFSSDLDDEIPF